MTAGRRGEGHPVRLATIAGEWVRIGCIGFGGPPTHIAMLRRRCVERGWVTAAEFEDGVAATNLLPGPTSTQLAIFLAWRLRGTVGAVVGGLCFVVPGLAVILALSAVFLASHPPDAVLGAAAGAGAAVPAVAVNAAWMLVRPSWARIGGRRPDQVRWVLYALAGGVAGAVVGAWLVLVLVGCGLIEVAVREPRHLPGSGSTRAFIPAVGSHLVAVGGLGALAWVAFKVGALSYGGGFVIIPLMQHDAVHNYHWMTNGQFLNAVALGQVTPGPVVHTVAVVGYAAGGIGGGLLAAAVAFAPSFAFVIVGGRHFDRLRANQAVQAFLTGAGPCVIGAIAGSAVPLGLALAHLWQLPLLAVAAVWLLVLRRGVVVAIVGAGLAGVVAALAGAPLAH
ncbi:MAG TPA: chromate efflux transporter [Acidimicrobiales bacterium]|nr:chromate efflux transporter [Acidimicrobiales bacterium]